MPMAEPHPARLCAAFSIHGLTLNAAHLSMDLILIELSWVPDIPCVHDQADAPTDDRKDRPEESAGIGCRPNHDDERVHKDIPQQMCHEVVAFLQLLDGAITHRIGQRLQVTSHAYSPASRRQIRNVDQGGPESLVPRWSRRLAGHSRSTRHSWRARSEILGVAADRA